MNHLCSLSKPEPVTSKKHAAYTHAATPRPLMEARSQEISHLFLPSEDKRVKGILNMTLVSAQTSWPHSPTYLLLPLLGSPIHVHVSTEYNVCLFHCKCPSWTFGLQYWDVIQAVNIETFCH